MAEWHAFAKSKDRWFGGGTILGHVNYRPSLDLSVVNATLSNAFLAECIAKTIGPDAVLLSMGGNVNLPGSGFQPIHVDGDMDASYLAVNVPLGDVDETNGSLEVYPGSHLQKISLRQFKRQYHSHSGVRVPTNSGDIIIRYPNVWHRGTQNRSSHPRFMLAFTFGPPSASKTVSVAATSVKGEFSSNYFARSTSGYAKEIVCRYAPNMFDFIRSRARV